MAYYDDFLRKRYSPEGIRSRYGSDVTFSPGKGYTADGKTFGSPEELLAYQRERTKLGARKRAMDESLAKYRSETAGFRDDLLRKFRTSSEYRAATGAAGLAMQTQQAANRLNLGDEFTTAIQADAASRVRQQLTQSNLDFESMLSQLLAGEEIGFIKGEFDYMHRLQAMDYAHEISKDMARFQVELQKDLDSMGLLGDLLEIGGTIFGMKFLGPKPQPTGP